MPTRIRSKPLSATLGRASTHCRLSFSPSSFSVKALSSSAPPNSTAAGVALMTSPASRTVTCFRSLS